MEREGIALYAVSYDSVDVLAGFGEKYGIRYPLLSDEGSTVIRQLGILNEQAGEAVFGIPHPGVFVLDGDGRVTEKRFYPSYRERDTGVGLLSHVLGIATPARGAGAVLSREGVQIRATLDSPHYAWGQRVWLTVELEMAEGLHVYGRPIPEGYYPVEIEVEPMERVTVGEPEWPATKPFQVTGLDEAFQVYDGKLSVSIPISFMVVDAGEQTVKVRVSYQACTETECLQPESVDLELRIEEMALVERPQPRG